MGLQARLGKGVNTSQSELKNQPHFLMSFHVSAALIPEGS